jgi:glycosyltransferase involved in cell wall biosynthesis
MYYSPFYIHLLAIMVRTHIRRTWLVIALCCIFLLLLDSLNFPNFQEPNLNCAIHHRLPNCEITILMPIYNKAHYLELSLGSILKLPHQNRICILCYDDGSTDNLHSTIQPFQNDNPRFRMIGDEKNRGILYARIRLIESVDTPWLAFLDPDDELYGSGLPRALEVAKLTGASIVQFGCRMVIRMQTNRMSCWREPVGITVLNVSQLTQLWLNKVIDVHLHRKVWRTSIFQSGVAEIPNIIRRKRIARMEDRWLYGYFLKKMTGEYRYIPDVGEIRHFGWIDSSSTEEYQSKNTTREQKQFVAQWTREEFGPFEY